MFQTEPHAMDGEKSITKEKPPDSPTNTSTIATRDLQPRPAHQRLVLTDPVAFRYARRSSKLDVSD